MSRVELKLTRSARHPLEDKTMMDDDIVSTSMAT